MLAPALLLGACGSTALSPFAGEFGDDDGFVSQRKPDAGAPLPPSATRTPSTSVSPVAVPTPGALPPIALPPSASPPIPPPPVVTSPSPLSALPPGLDLSPWLPPERDLPSCDIHNVADECPELFRLLTEPKLACDLSQVGQRCPYPSDEDGANLLECTLGASGPIWQRIHARCSRNCWEEMPHPFAELDDGNCSERPLVPCEDAPTNQDAIDSELKRVAAECNLPRGMVLGMLVSPEGCGRALFIEDTAGLAKCAANALARRRFSCGQRCASSKEVGDLLLQ